MVFGYAGSIIANIPFFKEYFKMIFKRLASPALSSILNRQRVSYKFIDIGETFIQLLLNQVLLQCTEQNFFSIKPLYEYFIRVIPCINVTQSISGICRKLSRAGKVSVELYQHVFQVISILLVKLNSDMIQNTFRGIFKSNVIIDKFLFAKGIRNPDTKQPGKLTSDSRHSGYNYNQYTFVGSQADKQNIASRRRLPYHGSRKKQPVFGTIWIVRTCVIPGHMTIFGDGRILIIKKQKTSRKFLALRTKKLLHRGNTIEFMLIAF